jgi:tRNA-specific 2-thiouridylase
LLAKQLSAIDASWIDGAAPISGEYSAKTRYRQVDSACSLISRDEEHLGFELVFPDAQWAVTPGQSAVLYDGDICLGGGIIAR